MCIRDSEYTGREAFKGLASDMEGKTYERDQASSLGNINEDSLDAWIGPGGALTQSSDADAAGYYEGVGDKSAAATLLYKPDETGDGAVVTGWPSDLTDRDSQIYDLYQNVFGRNPDAAGLEYWTGAGGEGMSIADIEASFKGSAEAKGRADLGGTNNYQSIADYLANQTSGTGRGSNSG